MQNSIWYCSECLLNSICSKKKKKKASGNDQILVMKLLWLFVVPMNDYLIFFLTKNDYLIKGPFGLNLLLLKLKTKNWKHCSKIIFKCVNSAVAPIFNIFKFVNSALQYVNSACTVHKQWILSLKVNNHGLNKKKKKKEKTCVCKCRRPIQTAPMFVFHYSLSLFI